MMGLIKFISSAALAATVAANVIPPRQATYTGYLFNTFTDANHTGLQYLSNGNTPYEFLPLNGGNPLFVSEVGTKGIRDLYLTTNSGRSVWYLIATGELLITHLLLARETHVWLTYYRS
jgi:hypothetical protein